MNALSAGAVLQERYASFKQKQFIDNASIENSGSKATNYISIELPDEIKELITGSDYWIQAKTNRYKMLIRQGHLQTLLRLTKMARENATKEDPSHWFAKSCLRERLRTCTNKRDGRCISIPSPTN